MKVSKGLKALVSLAVLATTLPAMAYDEDTHFYGTYAMARFSGIRHEVASKIALSAQWMDESFISDPTSMIFLPVTGVRKRRLLHFPSSRVVGALNAGAQQSVLPVEKLNQIQKMIAKKIVDFTGYEGELNGLNFLTETQEDHPLASELLMEGLKEGNLMKAAASLHVIEDSFAHAGTPAEQGHAAFWHWPDRPFANIEKYKRMVRTTMKAIVAIRSQLPIEALDCQMMMPAKKSARESDLNCAQSAATLAENYLQLTPILDAVKKDILKDPIYVRTSLREILKQSVKTNYTSLTNKQIHQILSQIDPNNKMDSYEWLEKIIVDLFEQDFKNGTNILNIRHILEDMGRLKSSSAIELKDYVESFRVNEKPPGPTLDRETIHNFVHVMAHELLKWQVPAPLGDTHRMEFEDDKAPMRKIEMKLRVRNMRRAIYEVFGTNVKFIESNSKDDVGFGREVRMEKSAEPVIPKQNARESEPERGVPGSEVKYITFSLAEKNAWDRMIFKYLYPDLTDKDLLHIATSIRHVKDIAAEIIDYRATRRAVIDRQGKTKNPVKYVKHKAELTKLFVTDGPITNTARLTLATRNLFKSLKPMLPAFIQNTLSAHLTPREDNFFYRSPRLMKQYQEAGEVKPLLTEKDTWQLEELLVASAPAPSPK